MIQNNVPSFTINQKSGMINTRRNMLSTFGIVQNRPRSDQFSEGVELMSARYVVRLPLCEASPRIHHSWSQPVSIAKAEMAGSWVVILPSPSTRTTSHAAPANRLQ